MKASGKLGGVVSLGVVFDRISKQLAFRTKMELVVSVVFQFGRRSKSLASLKAPNRTRSFFGSFLSVLALGRAVRAVISWAWWVAVVGAYGTGVCWRGSCWWIPKAERLLVSFY